MAWDGETEECVAPRLRRALRSVEESDGRAGPLAGNPARLAAAPWWADEQEEIPLRGRLRRALLAAD
jgi:hypothetical protein